MRAGVDYSQVVNETAYLITLFRKNPDSSFIIHPKKLKYLPILAHHYRFGKKLSLKVYCNSVGIPATTLKYIIDQWSLTEWEKQKLQITRILVESKINTPNEKETKETGLACADHVQGDII